MQYIILEHNMEKKSLILAVLIIPIFAIMIPVIASAIDEIYIDRSEIKEVQYGGGFCCSFIKEPNFNLHSMFVMIGLH